MLHLVQYFTMTEQQMLDKQSAMQANFDGKKFICGPWLGDRGGAFELIFRPYFETALMKIVNISTLYQHICDETAVGSANGPAHPAGAGLVAQGWLSQQAARARELLDAFDDAVSSFVFCEVNCNKSSGCVDKVDHVLVPVYDTWRKSTADIAMDELTEIAVLSWLFLCEWDMNMGAFGTTITKGMVKVVFERRQTNGS